MIFEAPHPTVSIPCPKCGRMRPLKATYWQKLEPKRKERVRAKLCKKCGSGRKPSHGLGYNRIYMVWYNMMVRCGHIVRDDLPETVARNYRDKGIRVCEEWQVLENFAAWAFAHEYKVGAYLDRIKNAKGYDPANCRWVTPRFSGQHRSNVKLNYEKAAEIRALYNAGESIKNLCVMYEVSHYTIRSVCTGDTWRE